MGLSSSRSINYLRGVRSPDPPPRTRPSSALAATIHALISPQIRTLSSRVGGRTPKIVESPPSRRKQESPRATHTATQRTQPRAQSAIYYLPSTVLWGNSSQLPLPLVTPHSTAASSRGGASAQHRSMTQFDYVGDAVRLIAR